MSSGSPIILIVDDEEAVLNICKHLLQKMGYNVLGANNSSDAYRIANENKGTIVVAILDYSLSSMKDESVPKALMK
jgi:DNA-binding NtrC family response regulator